MLNEGFSEKDLIPFNYPTLKEFEDSNIQIVYLGWFLGDWSLLNNGAISSLTGIKIRRDRVGNTGDLFGVTSLDEDWVTLNQMIKYYKFGFGRATDYVNEMIRMGDITRDEAIPIVTKYDGACSADYIESFCEYIKIPVDDFWSKVISLANKDLFDVKENRKLIRKFKIGSGETF